MSNFLTASAYKKTITPESIAFYKKGWAVENESLEKGIHFMKLLKTQLEKIGEEKFNENGMTKHVLNAVKKLYPEGDNTNFVYTVDKVGVHNIEIGITTGSSPTIKRAIKVFDSQGKNLYQAYMYDIERIVNTWAEQHELNQKSIETIDQSAVIYNAALEQVLAAVDCLPALPWDLRSELGLYALKS